MFDQQVTFLYAKDLSASSAFYETVLGLDLVLDQGPCRIYRVSQNGFLGVCQCREDSAPARDGVIVTLVSQDVDGWYDRLLKQGAEIEVPPRQNEDFNIYHFFLRDPDGYLLEVQRFCDPTWPE